MLRFLIRRLTYMIATLMAVSLVSFLILQAAPGDYADIYAAKKSDTGAVISQEEVETFRIQLGLDKPWYVQYWRWVSNAAQGDWGTSWEWRRPVGEVIAERMPLTLIIAFSTLLFMYGIAIPIGIYSALRQYSVTDHVVTVLGYVGLATPNFLLALVLMYIGQKYWGQSVGGLFSPDFESAPWSWAKFVDLLEHLWAPVVVLGTAGTAFLIRAMRAAVLDELNKMYVLSARAGGLSPFKLMMKYPVRVALNPIVSTLGWRLTYVISGAPIVGYVMALPDAGPLFLHSLLNQDMQLAGALIFMFSALTIVGTFFSDLLLALLDPRMRLE